MLEPGTKIGPYEITGALGAGGMGGVYRARDTKLGRDVAIKVLPESFAKDEGRVARFEREARAVAALSHPNILAIYDFGREDGHVFAVMELLEGETLRERLALGALPARKAIEYGAQMARGLAAAHEKSITHRDLKPDNLFITHDGRLKIFDFGLATEAVETAAGGSDSSAPTRTAVTDPGVVLGTVGYMSPEQVRGERVDHRSDIFAFGSSPVSPDGSILAAFKDDVVALYPLNGGEPRTLDDVPASMAVIRFTPDGRFLYVKEDFGRSARIHRVDIDTGRRELWRTIEPSDPGGLDVIYAIQISDDGESYYYSFSRTVSDLYLVEGLR